MFSGYSVGGKKLYGIPGPYFVNLLSFWLTLMHPQHPITFLFHSPHFPYFPCRNALFRKLLNYSHGLCMHMLDSGLSLSRMSKYWVSQELVKQTHIKCMYGVGRILFQYLACPSGGNSDLRNWVSITKPPVYHSSHFYPPKEAPIPFENITIGFSSFPRF